MTTVTKNKMLCTPPQDEKENNVNSTGVAKDNESKPVSTVEFKPENSSSPPTSFKKYDDVSQLLTSLDMSEGNNNKLVDDESTATANTSAMGSFVSDSTGTTGSKNTKAYTYSSIPRPSVTSDRPRPDWQNTLNEMSNKQDYNEINRQRDHRETKGDLSYIKDQLNTTTSLLEAVATPAKEHQRKLREEEKQRRAAEREVVRLQKQLKAKEVAEKRQADAARKQEAMAKEGEKPRWVRR